MIKRLISALFAVFFMPCCGVAIAANCTGLRTADCVATVGCVWWGNECKSSCEVLSSNGQDVEFHMDMNACQIPDGARNSYDQLTYSCDTDDYLSDGIFSCDGSEPSVNQVSDKRLTFEYTADGVFTVSWTDSEGITQTVTPDEPDSMYIDKPHKDDNGSVSISNYKIKYRFQGVEREALFCEDVKTSQYYQNLNGVDKGVIDDWVPDICIMPGFEVNGNDNGETVFDGLVCDLALSKILPDEICGSKNNLYKKDGCGWWDIRAVGGKTTLVGLYAEATWQPTSEDLTCSIANSDAKFMMDVDMPANKTFSFIINAPGEYVVDWDDGTVNRYLIKPDDSSWQISHTYTAANVYRIKMSGQQTGARLSTAASTSPVIDFSGNTYIFGMRGDLSSIFNITSPYMFAGTFKDCTGLINRVAVTFSSITTTTEYMFQETFMNTGAEAWTLPGTGMFLNIIGQPAKNAFARTFKNSNMTSYVPVATFENLTTTGYTAGYAMSEIFSGTQMDTECPDETYTYTGYSAFQTNKDWGNVVSCGTCPNNGSLDAGADSVDDCYIGGAACSDDYGNGTTKLYWDGTAYTVQKDSSCVYDKCEGGYTLEDGKCMASVAYECHDDVELARTHVPGGSTVSVDQAFTNCTKTGHHFDGWLLSKDSTKYQPGDEYTVDYPFNTFKAQFAANKFTIKYDANGGTGTMADMTCTYGTECPLAENNFTKTGYNLTSWYDGYNYYGIGRDISGQPYENDSVVTMSANWEPNRYAIIYDPNGGTGTMDYTYCTYDEDCQLAANTFTNPGYVFAGWKYGDVVYENNATVQNLTSEHKGMVTLVAQWEPVGFSIVIAKGFQTFSFVINAPGVSYDCGDGIAKSADQGQANTCTFTDTSKENVVSFSGQATKPAVGSSVMTIIADRQSIQELRGEITKVFATPYDGMFKGLFQGATSLQKIGRGFFDGITTALPDMFVSTFEGCTNLGLVPVDLFANITGIPGANAFAGVFRGANPTMYYADDSVVRGYVPYEFFTNLTITDYKQVSAAFRELRSDKCPDGQTDNKTLSGYVNALVCKPESEFTITTIDMAANTTFSFSISAAGSYTIDWGDGNVQKIEKTDTTAKTYTHTYEKGGVHTIGIAGEATTYNATNAAISFSRNTNIAKLGGSLGAIFDGPARPYMFVNTFRQCSNLTNIPDTLFSGISGAAENTFYNTFSGCTSLQSIPDTLFSGVDGAANNMFSGTFSSCTSLTEIPDALFSGVAGAANNMFSGTFSACTSLEEIPVDLFKTVTGEPGTYAFANLFGGATKITKFVDADGNEVSTYVPEQFFGGMDDTNADAFTNAFAGTQLATVCPDGTININPYYATAISPKVVCEPFTPEFKVRTIDMPAGTTFGFTISAAGSYTIDWGDGDVLKIEKTDTTVTIHTHTYEKGGVHTINIAGEATTYNATNAAISFGNNTYVAVLEGSLGEIFGGTAQPKMFSSTFRGCTSLQLIPDTLFSGISGAAEGMFGATFSGCGSLRSIPDTLFSGVDGAANNMFSATFSGCTSLTEIPDTLFSGVAGAANNMFRNTFSGCTSLQSIPSGLFSGVSGAAESMFNCTFQMCTNLTTIPDTLFSGVDGAANYMFGSTFQGCTSLQSIPVDLFKTVTGEPGTNAFANLFNGATNITKFVDAGGNEVSTYVPEQFFGGMDDTNADAFTKAFAGTGLAEGCPDGYVNANPYYADAINPKVVCRFNPEFTIKTINMEPNTMFSFNISAAGNYTIDWGDGDIETIKKTDTNGIRYSHTYANDGVYIIRMAGNATAYKENTAAISFSSNKNIAELYGSLGAIFGDTARPSMFQGAFSGCTNLTTIPDTLFSGVTGAANYMFEDAFSGCTSLTEIPGTLFSGVTGAADDMFNYTFMGCTSLQSIPSGLFSGVSGAANSMFSSTFYDCISLQSIPSDLFSGVTGAADDMFNYTFGGCTSLQSIPSGLFSGVTGAANFMFQDTFSGCTSLQSIPSDLFSGVTGAADYMFSNTFYDCRSLQSIPSDLFSGVTGAAESMFQDTFGGCTSLQSIPGTLFSGVSGAAEHMFNSTFSGCTSLQSIPVDLFATVTGEPGTDAFAYLFNGATKITKFVDADDNEISTYVPEQFFGGMDDTNADAFTNAFAGTGLAEGCPDNTYSLLDVQYVGAAVCSLCPENGQSVSGDNLSLSRCFIPTECSDATGKQSGKNYYNTESGLYDILVCGEYISCNTGYYYDYNTDKCETAPYLVTYLDEDDKEVRQSGVSYGDMYTFSAEPISKQGYTQNGWLVVNPESMFGEKYEMGETIKYNFAESITLKPEYSANTFELAFQYDNADNAGSVSLPQGIVATYDQPLPEFTEYGEIELRLTEGLGNSGWVLKVSDGWKLNESFKAYNKNGTSTNACPLWSENCELPDENNTTVNVYPVWTTADLKCAPGYYGYNKQCAPCHAGNACPGWDTWVSADQEYGMFQCPENSFSNGENLDYCTCAQGYSVDADYNGSTKLVPTAQYGFKNVSCQKKQVPMYYDLNGGYGNIETDYWEYGTVATPVTARMFNADEKAYRPGYTFGGWGEKPSAQTPVSEYANYTEPKTLYAIWMPCGHGTYMTAAQAQDLQTECTACPPEYPSTLDIASENIEQCYADCEAQKDVDGGVAFRDQAYVLYGNQCTFSRGQDENGNSCDIINDVCLVTDCRPDFEMIDGKCVACARDFALGYNRNGNCQVERCVWGFHPNGDKCEQDEIDCDAPNAVSAKQIWDSSVKSYGACVITQCAPEMHIEANTCVSNVRTCALENGFGEQVWNDKRNVWEDCVATHCKPGYTNDARLTNENWKQCGRCNNMFGLDGKLAVSSYVSECEIATCMYQGEKYVLENNECRLICDDYRDETGRRYWDEDRAECVHDCGNGYLPW